jgi:hypothetical protein
MTRKETIEFIETRYQNFTNQLLRHVNQCDSYGESIDTTYGHYVVTLTFDNDIVKSMNWSAIKMEMYGSVYCDLLSQLVTGMTVEEAANVAMQEVEDRYELKWPGWGKPYCKPAWQALQNALKYKTHHIK